MKKITRKHVDALLAGSSLATYENPATGVKGVYRRDAGPAASFRTEGTTWKHVYITRLVARGTAESKRLLAEIGVEA